MKIEIKKTKSPDLIQITTIDERWYHYLPDDKFLISSSWIASYYPKGKQFEIWLAKQGWDEAQLIKETAGKLGGRVHNAIDSLLQGNELEYNATFPDGDGEYAELSADEWWTIMTFSDWWSKTKPTIIQNEQAVYNLEHGYAGTLDLIAKIEDETWLIDFKTSKSIYPSHEIQLSSYKHAINGIKIDKMGILQVGYKLNKAGWKLTEIEDDFDLFLAVKKIFHNEVKNINPPQKDYPIKIKLDL